MMKESWIYLQFRNEIQLKVLITCVFIILIFDHCAIRTVILWYTNITIRSDKIQLMYRRITEFIRLK